MHALISAVGERTEHWEGFFAALAREPDLEVTVVAADISALARDRLQALAEQHRRLSVHVSGHVIGEQLTGHMASISYRPGSWRALRGLTVDVVHIIGEPAYLSTYQTIRFRNRFWPRTPISHYAAQNVVSRFPWPFPRLERYAYEQIDVAFPITPAAAQVLRSKGYRGRQVIVPLGVDRGCFRPPPSRSADEFTVGFVGRLEQHKGVGDLLAAAELLDCRLLIVGDGALTSHVEAEAARRPGRIERLAWTTHDDLPALLGRMHALALPSIEVIQRNVLPWWRVPLREQFGRVLVEAMACGVPVVASDVGEIAHVVGDGGLLVAPQRPDLLAHAFACVRDDHRLASRLREAALARAADFDWAVIARNVREQWSGLVRLQARGQVGLEHKQKPADRSPEAPPAPPIPSNARTA